MKPIDLMIALLIGLVSIAIAASAVVRVSVVHEQVELVYTLQRMQQADIVRLQQKIFALEMHADMCNLRAQIPQASYITLTNHSAGTVAPLNHYTTGSVAP